MVSVRSVCVVVLVTAISLLTPRRISRAGKKAVARLKQQHVELEQQLADGATRMDQQLFLLGSALFGVGLLADGPLNLVPQALTTQLPRDTGAWAGCASDFTDTGCAVDAGGGDAGCGGGGCGGCGD